MVATHEAFPQEAPKKRSKKPITSEGRRQASVFGEIEMPSEAKTKRLRGVSDASVSGRFDTTDTEDVAALPIEAPKVPENQAPRGRRKTVKGPYGATRPPTEPARTKSGEINAKPNEVIEDLTDLAIEEEPPKNIEVNEEDFPEITVVEEPEPPRKKRAKRITLTAQQAAELKQQAGDSGMAARVDQAMQREDAAEEAERHPEYRPEEPKPYTVQEEAWFKRGENDAQIQAQADRQEMEDVRRQIASYEPAKKETVIDTQEEIDAAVGQAETMLKSDELHPDLFNVRDYEFLLTQQARIDRELEHAGWWKARGLRSELRETRRQLEDYEQQIQSVIGERASGRADGALTGAEKEQIKQPSRRETKPAAKPGSGTTLNKPGFFARLFGKK